MKIYNVFLEDKRDISGSLILGDLIFIEESKNIIEMKFSNGYILRGDMKVK